MNYCDTEDWHLAAFVKWVPTNYPRRMACSCRCFGSLTDSRDCSDCGGDGYHTINHPPTAAPATPKGLTEHMQKAWKEWFQKEPTFELPWPYNTEGEKK